MDAPSLAPTMVENYLAFARRGMLLCLLGGRTPTLNTSVQELSINALSPYEPYQIPRAQWRIQGHGVDFEMVLSGLSAVGFVPESSLFTPVLRVLDRYNRTKAFALSTMQAPPAFKGGTWLLSGVKETEFYLQPAVCQTLVHAMLSKASPSPPSPGGAPGTRFAPWKDKPRGPIAIDPKTKRFVYQADGSRYFMLGADYFRGAFNDAVSAQSLAADFRIAAQGRTLTLTLTPIELSDCRARGAQHTPDLWHLARHAEPTGCAASPLGCPQGDRTPYPGHIRMLQGKPRRDQAWRRQQRGHHGRGCSERPPPAGRGVGSRL